MYLWLAATADSAELWTARVALLSAHTDNRQCLADEEKLGFSSSRPDWQPGAELSVSAYVRLTDSRL